MPEDENPTRAEWARAGLVAFATATGQDPDDQAEVVTDLLADLRHYCDLAEIPWEEVLRHATMHYRAEADLPVAVVSLELTEPELRLAWMGTETLRDANPDDADALSLDEKVTAAMRSLVGGRS